MKKRKNSHFLYPLVFCLSVAGFGLFQARPAVAASCGGVKTSIISCNSQKNDKKREGENALFELMKSAIKILTAGIGILAVGAVVFGGILYSSAGGSVDNIRRAKNIWINTAIGLILFASFVTVTNFLIPGGIF